MTDHESIRAECLALPGVTEDLPFGPEVLVFRVAGKIFALLALDSQPPTVNLKCEPAKAIALREAYAAITPGYHMNKQHWNTLVLDGSLPASLVRRLIWHSYARIHASLPKKVQAELGFVPPADE